MRFSRSQRYLFCTRLRREWNYLRATWMTDDKWRLKYATKKLWINNDYREEPSHMYLIRFRISRRWCFSSAGFLVSRLNYIQILYEILHCQNNKIEFVIENWKEYKTKHICTYTCISRVCNVAVERYLSDQLIRLCSFACTKSRIKCKQNGY